jgi:hypothetical protein
MSETFAVHVTCRVAARAPEYSERSDSRPLAELLEEGGDIGAWGRRARVRPTGRRDLECGEATLVADPLMTTGARAAGTMQRLRHALENVARANRELTA